MLITVLLLAVLALAVGSVSLTLSLLVWSGTRRTQPPAAPAEEEKQKPFPLSDAKMQEGIANLLGFQPGRGESDC